METGTFCRRLCSESWSRGHRILPLCAAPDNGSVVGLGCQEQGFRIDSLVGCNMTEYVVVDPNVCADKPTIRGTRIMVKNILGIVAGGYTVDRILEAYPKLIKEAVQAAPGQAPPLTSQHSALPLVRNTEAVRGSAT